MSPNRLSFIFSHLIRRSNDTIEIPDLNPFGAVRLDAAGVDGWCSPTDPVRVQRRDRIVICISHSSPDSNAIHTRDLPRFRGEGTPITSRARRSFCWHAIITAVSQVLLRRISPFSDVCLCVYMRNI